jgi:tetratricopeptide (TPR) repeat protein
MFFLKAWGFAGFALALVCAAQMQGCASLSSSKESAQKQSLANRDVVAKALTRVANGPLQPDEAPGFFLLAEQLYFERKIDESTKLFSAVFEVDPTVVSGVRLSDLYLVQSKYVEAERVANKLSVLFPQNPEPPLAQARVFMAQGKNEEALVMLKNAYSSIKNREEIGVAYVDLLLRMGKAKETSEFLTQAVKDPAASPYMLEKLAEIRIQEKKLGEAKILVERLLRVAPDDVEGWTLAGFLAVEEKDYLHAEKYFREAYGKQPQNDTLARYYVTQLLRLEKYQEARRLLLRLESSAEESRALEPELTFQLALVLYKLEDYAGARLRFLRLTGAGDDAGRALFYGGQCDEMLKNFVGALESYQKIPVESAYYKQALQRRVFVHLEQGQFENARTLARDIGITKESSESEYGFLAATYARLKDYSKAISIAKDGAAKFPGAADLLAQAAMWLEFTEGRDAAIQASKAVIAKFPKHSNIYNYLAYTMAEAGLDLNVALQYAKKAIELEPKNGFYLDTMGWVLFKKQQYAQAENFLIRALGEESAEPVIFEHLGEVALVKRDFAKALKYFEAAEAKFAAEPEWKIASDREWLESRKRVGLRIQELRKKALSQ